MKRALLLVALVACDKRNKAKDDASIDPPLIDAAALDAAPPACRSAGTHVTASASLGTVEGAALLATSPPGDPRLFVLEQRGAIRIFDESRTLVAMPFLDLSARNTGPVLAGGEQGLLGLAFHPQYATNGLFFIYYTRRQAGDGTNQTRDVVARCKVSANDPNRAEPGCVEVLAIPDFASNHNGGMIEFGKDGKLYIGTGDGGSANDPNGNAQAIVDDPSTNTIALLGKMLRIDVDARDAGEYGIPADNPYAGGGGAPEIYMRGLRNPWRWSFDRATGDLWIGDVGQGAIEEVDLLRSGTLANKNLGWKLFEGTRCQNGPCPPPDGFFAPQDERSHTDDWSAIIGGQVYRGDCYPDLVGTYLYTDNSRNRLMLAKADANDRLTVTEEPAALPTGPASIHEDAAGELYLTSTDGNVYRLEAHP